MSDLEVAVPLEPEASNFSFLKESGVLLACLLAHFLHALCSISILFRYNPLKVSALALLLFLVRPGDLAGGCASKPMEKKSFKFPANKEMSSSVGMSLVSASDRGRLGLGLSR